MSLVSTLASACGGSATGSSTDGPHLGTDATSSTVASTAGAATATDFTGDWASPCAPRSYQQFSASRELFSWSSAGDHLKQNVTLYTTADCSDAGQSFSAEGSAHLVDGPGINGASVWSIQFSGGDLLSMGNFRTGLAYYRLARIDGDKLYTSDTWYVNQSNAMTIRSDVAYLRAKP